MNNLSSGYKLLLFSSLVATFADSLFGPLYAIYVQGIGGDLLVVGNTIALYSVTTGLLIILIGKISDHKNKALLTTSGFLLSALGTLAYLFIKTPIQLYSLQIIFALSTALLSAPLSALFSKYIDKKRAGFLWALEGGGGKILAGVGIATGTLITHTFGFTVVFLLIFLLQMSAAISQMMLYTQDK